MDFSSHKIGLAIASGAALAGLWYFNGSGIDHGVDSGGPYVIAIDQGTSSTRVVVFDNSLEMVCSHQKELELITPNPGWVEHDPMVILHDVHHLIDQCLRTMNSRGIRSSSVGALGITNQRETVVVWDRVTGLPLHNAIVWMDTRTTSTIEDLLGDARINNDRNYFRKSCGLPISTYFSAMKMKWLLEHSPDVQSAVVDGRALFGTIDSWLIWNLTGGAGGSDTKHVTDVTNASRTMLMNLEDVCWDHATCEVLNIDMGLLPTIKGSSEIYGHVSHGPLSGVPISGCLGDQQAALVGQLCFQKGQVKSTYGTGSFVLFNTGDRPVHSDNGLLTTVAYQLGPRGGEEPVAYALEGAVANTGSVFRWLRELGLFERYDEIDGMAKRADTNGGVVFVPAFSGLFAPYWDESARGAILGLTRAVSRAQIVRAALEAVAHRTREVIEEMAKDSKVPLSSLRVDGGLSQSNALMQIQADILGPKSIVIRPSSVETTVLGAALAAGLAIGLYTKEIASQSSLCAPDASWNSSIGDEERSSLITLWKKGVARCCEWIE